MSSLGSIVVVGASTAGLRAAEVLREEGFDGRLTLVGNLCIHKFLALYPHCNLCEAPATYVYMRS